MQLSHKTLHDLELIKGDSEAFGIIWKRIQNVAPLELLDEEEVAEAAAANQCGGGGGAPVGDNRKKIPPSTVVFYVVSSIALRVSRLRFECGELVF